MVTLEDLTTAGMSEYTSATTIGGFGGIEGSRAAAHADWASGRLKRWTATFQAEGEQQALPSALIAAIASRESGGRHIVGDHGHGIGVMQIDARYWPIDIKQGPVFNIQYGAGILKDYYDALLKKLPTWTPAWCLRGALVAYNSGIQNVRTMKHIDVGTTGSDYSSDVWARARYLSTYIHN